MTKLTYIHERPDKYVQRMTNLADGLSTGEWARIAYYTELFTTPDLTMGQRENLRDMFIGIVSSAGVEWLENEFGNYTRERVISEWKQREETRRAEQDPKVQYEAYIKSPGWQNKALAAKERAGGRCRVCNSNVGLQVHHRTYERLGHEDPDDLTVLCSECHELFHDNGRLKHYG